MQRQPRTKPAARNAMRVTIRTPPDKKRSPRKNAEKQPLRSPSRRVPSAKSKLTIRERFILSFSVPLILVSLGLLTFIASHVIAKMVGRAKARKAERIATAYVDLLNVTHASTATSEAAILIASETASLGAAAPLNASNTAVTSGTITGFIDVYVRKGHRLEGGWRPVTLAPKMLDDYPGPPSDDAVAPGTIGSAVHTKGAVTPSELALITSGDDSGRGIGVDAVTTSTTAAHVVESARRSYVNRGPERTDVVWRTTASVYTAAETKTIEVTRAGDGEPAFFANARPSGTSATPLGAPHVVPGSAGRTQSEAFTADFFDPYHNRYEDTGSPVANGIVSGDLSSVGPPFPDTMEPTARAPSSTTALHAATLFDVPPVDDGISVTSTAIGAPTTSNQSAFITAHDNTKIVDLVPLQVITRAETSSQAASAGTQEGVSTTASTPVDVIAIQQTLVPLHGDGDTPSLTSTRMVPYEQPQERRTTTITGTFRSTSTTLERDAQFGTAMAGETIEKMVTPQYMLIDMRGTTLKDGELRSELFFNSTELAISGTASQVEMFVSSERAGSATSRAKTTAPSSDTGRNVASGRAQVPIAKTSSDHNVKQRDTGSFLNDMSTPAEMIVIQQTLMPMEADTQSLTSVSRANGANEISDETSRSTGIDDKNNTSHVPIVTTTKNQTRRVSGADEVDAGVQARWSDKTSTREIATPNHSNGFAAYTSRIYPTVENASKTHTEQSTARNAKGSPITNEYGYTNVDSLYTSRDVLSKGTGQHATSVSTHIIDRDTSVQVKHTGKDLPTMHTSNHRPSTTATVRAMTMFPGYLRTGARINQGTTTPVSEPTVPSVSKSRPSRNQRRVLPTTAVSVTASILKDPTTALPRARVRSPMVTSTLYRTVSLPTTISAPRKIQPVNVFTTIAPPIVISGTNLSEAKVFRDVRSSRDSARRNTTIPAMIIQTAMTGDRAGKPVTVTRETRVASYVRVPTLDKLTPPVTWVNNSTVHIPASAVRSTMEATESRSTASGEKTTVTNTIPNWVRVDTSYTREEGNVIIRTGKTGERQPATTSVATGVGPEITLRLVKDTVTVRDVDEKNVAEAESASNGNRSFGAFTKALSDIEAPAQNSRDSRSTDTTTTRNPVVVDASSEAPADVASPFGPSEPSRQNRTFPAWSIGGALNANVPPIAAFGKPPVNAAHSEVKSVSAWRIRTAATRRSVSVMTSASRAHGDVTPRNSSSIYWSVTASATRRSVSAMASAATAHGDATPASSSHDNRGSGTIIPAMIMQTAMTRLKATTAAKPETAIRLRVSASDIKAPSARLKNSGVRVSSNAEGRPSFTTVLETRRFSQDEVMTTDKRMQPAWPIVSALTRRLLPVITRSSAVFRRSSPVGSAGTTGSVETRTFPAMLIEHAAKGATVSRLTKRGSDTRETPVHGLDNDDFDRNPILTRRVNDSILADAFGPNPVTARREDQRRTEERVSDGKTVTAWPILDAIRMRSPRPAVRSRPVNGASGWVRKAPSAVGLLRAATTRMKQLGAKVHGFAVIETPPPRSTDKAVRTNYLRR